MYRVFLTIGLMTAPGCIEPDKLGRDDKQSDQTVNVEKSALDKIAESITEGRKENKAALAKQVARVSALEDDLVGCKDDIQGIKSDVEQLKKDFQELKPSPAKQPTTESKKPSEQKEQNADQKRSGDFAPETGSRNWGATGPTPSTPTNVRQSEPQPTPHPVRNLDELVTPITAAVGTAPCGFRFLHPLRVNETTQLRCPRLTTAVCVTTPLVPGERDDSTPVPALQPVVPRATNCPSGRTAHRRGVALSTRASKQSRPPISRRAG